MPNLRDLETPLEDLVKKAQVIVIGRLSEVREETINNIDFGSGTIEVGEVLRGKIKPSSQLKLVWFNHSNVICPRVGFTSQKNPKIWLLLSVGGDKYSVVNPFLLHGVEKRDKVIQFIKTYKSFQSNK